MFEWLFKYPMEIFREGSLAFPTPFRLELRIVCAVALAAAVVWLYSRIPSQVSRPRRVALGALRVLAVVILLFIIFPPVMLTKEVSVQDRFVAVVVDDSRSMTIKDAAGGTSRVEAAKRILFSDPGSSIQNPKSKIQNGGLLSGTPCGVRVFRFSSDIERAAGPDELKARGPTTDIFTALKGVDEKLRGVPLAAVVLVSDGNHNAAGDPRSAGRLMAAKRVPIYTLGLGNPNATTDLEVVSADAPRAVRRKTGVEVVATVRSYGTTDPYVVRLLRKNEVVGEMRVTPASQSDIRRLTFPIFLDRQGSYVYRVDIPPVAGEKITNNNFREVQIDVQETRLPVLYVEGSPRTEFRFLRGALFEDEDFRIVSVLRLGEKRFLVQGADDDKELVNGFPATKEKLFAYEAVIFGDIEASFFTKEQLAMVEAFVSERGGGFLMLGGVNSFNLGGYEGTPVAKMLPMTLGDRNTPYDYREFRIQVADGGVAHPVMHQNSDPLTNSNIWNSVSPLMGHNPTAGLKPGAVPLMENIQTHEPVLAVENYGVGRTAAFTTGGSWYWRMNRPAGDELHQRFWKQLIRWLAVGSKPKLSTELKTLYSIGEPVRISVAVLGNSLEPVNDAAVRARVEDPFGRVEEFPLEWILVENGVYEGTWSPRDPGEHKLTINADYAAPASRNVTPDASKNDVKLQTATSFLVGESYVEFSPGWQNAPLLKELAERTGGRYYTEADASRMAADIEYQVRASAASNPKVTEHTLWDMPIVFLVLFLTLSAEWLLKRRSGLP